MTVDTSALSVTRDALHQVAEHVLAAAQYRETGTVRLQVVAGGFETVRDVNGDRLSVVDGRLVVRDPAGKRSTALSTLGAAAEFAGITPGLPAAAYPAATAFDPDAGLAIDPDSVRLIAGWYELADAALLAFAARIGSAGQQPTLWPEHFDVGLTFDDVNYGASPGDVHFADPYLYVGPHSGPPRRDSFWNADFGAVRLIDQIPSVASAVAFFEQGRARAQAREDG